MREVRRLGDAAFLVDVPEGHRAAQNLAARIREAFGAAVDVVPGARSVGVLLCPGPGTAATRTGEGLRRELVELALHPQAVGPTAAADRPGVHEIPVELDGEDLGEVAAATGLTRPELEALVGRSELEVAFLGFMPGFAYLTGLPAPLGGLGRRETARTRVPAGSFAVAGGFAGIYPVASPGGWQLLGHSSLACFDPDTPPHALFRPGDRVRLVPCSGLPPGPLPARAPLTGSGLEVVDPGLLLLVEDLGRLRAGSLGVPRAGAADPVWLRIANLAVGNAEGAAALEITGGGCTLRAQQDLLVAVAGEGRLAVDGDESPPGLVTAVGAGQRLSVGRLAGPRRAVLAVRGGIDVRPYFESRSSDVVSGLWPGPLRAGDSLQVGTGSSPARRRFFLPEQGALGGPEHLPGRGAGGGREVVLRTIAGPDDVGSPPGEALQGPWRVGADSDRTGVRLRREGPALSGLASGTVPSHAVVTGAVQLLPSGEAVVLGPDSGPVGGYPVVATVATADLPVLGALVAGDSVALQLVTPGEAAAAARATEELVGRSVQGWFPTGFA